MNTTLLWKRDTPDLYKMFADAPRTTPVNKAVHRSINTSLIKVSPPLSPLKKAFSPFNSLKIPHHVTKMGANHSSSRPIPVRPDPHTPLRFGSVHTALPIDSGEFTASSTPYVPTDQLTDDALSAFLAQENYFGGFPPAPSMLSSNSEQITYSRTGSISSVSSSSDSPPPHRFTCPESSCPYTIIGYSTSEELEEHMVAVNHFASGFSNSIGLEFSDYDYDWLSAQEDLGTYPQHPITVQTKQQKVQQPQQCNCHHCLHQGDFGGFIQYEPHQPSMQIQMPPPPTIIGYHDAGFELVSWRQPKSAYDSSSNHKMKQAEYSSLVQSGMYMDFSHAGAVRSSFM